ncbi:UDP-N-acetylglucosamine 2-epimerase [Paenibacillus thermotolerans]|uniref:UDP-N-acetylglucosamine 2-epimerase n=1 Tax=Paenibacillus thermotolerans TaxID=3027807 RepID=UPI002368C94C|nr:MULTISPECIES: UDP-N-acetylglucosamine 2-epimerase [unclassified Paenibacillus]
MTERKICVVTGSRAEYGLLFWLMKEIQSDPDLKLQLIVTGMHLSPEFGLTYKTVEADGFHIDEKVEMLLSSDTPVGITKSMGLATIGFADALDRLKPDIVVLLGDRYEILCAAQAAMIAKIPIAHLHGGEVTEGAVDEAIRHAVTKMSHLHFVAADVYRERVIRMGEHPDKVFNVGALGLENIRRMTLMDRKEFETSVEFRLWDKNFLVTYHPVTLASHGPEQAMHELLRALDRFPDTAVIFTKPNSDTDGRVISRMIDSYVEQNPGRAKAYTSLGQLRYLSAIKHTDMVIGNSSSGIYEVPAFRKPTVNIGDRQKGRLKGASVIDCKEDAESIVQAVRQAYSDQFQNRLKTADVCIFGEGGASEQIKTVLKEADLSGIIYKKFFDADLTLGM